MHEKFALVLFIDPGVLQLCDPFTLQPFLAMTIPSTVFSFLDHFMIENNQMIAYNHN